MTHRFALMAASGAVGFLLAAATISFATLRQPELAPTLTTILVNATTAELARSEAVESYDLIAAGPEGQHFERLGLRDPVAIIEVPAGSWRIRLTARRPGGDVIGVGAADLLVGARQLDLTVRRLESDPEICGLFLDRDGHPTYVFDPLLSRCVPESTSPRG